MRWLLVVSCWSALLLGCRDRVPLTATLDLETPAPEPAEPCVDEGMRPAQLHLGDGTTSYNYYVIAEHLSNNAGSAKNTQETERLQNEAEQSFGASVLKSPSANVGESEFSHLLGAIKSANGGIGASVFDPHRLKVGAAGVQLDSMVLSRTRLAQVRAIGPDAPAAEDRYTCERLSELAKNCDQDTTRLPCGVVERVNNDCRGGIVAYYRPVLDYSSDESPSFLGVSVLVVEKTCERR